MKGNANLLAQTHMNNDPPFPLLVLHLPPTSPCISSPLLPDLTQFPVVGLSLSNSSVHSQMLSFLIHLPPWGFSPFLCVSTSLGLLSAPPLPVLVLRSRGMGPSRCLDVDGESLSKKEEVNTRCHSRRHDLVEHTLLGFM